MARSTNHFGGFSYFLPLCRHLTTGKIPRLSNHASSIRVMMLWRGALYNGDPHFFLVLFLFFQFSMKCTCRLTRYRFIQLGSVIGRRECAGSGHLLIARTCPHCNIISLSQLTFCEISLDGTKWSTQICRSNNHRHLCINHRRWGI